MSEGYQVRTPAETKAELLRLARSNPVVRRALAAYEVGAMTYQQALEAAIVCLAEGNSRLMDMVVRHHQTQAVMPYYVKVSPGKRC